MLFYEKVIYKTELGKAGDPNYTISYSCDFTAEKLAHSCANTNEVGVYHKASDRDPKRYVLCGGVTGEENMDEAPIYSGAGQTKFSFLMSSETDVILPYLRTTIMNGEPTTYDPTDPNNGNIYPTSYATKDFPYAMEIPFVEGKPFRWMQEGICITKGYDWSKTRNNWYVTPTDTNQLVPRAEGSTY